MISFLPETSRDTDGNLIVTLGETFSDVELVLKRTAFDGMKITIEVKIQRLMEKTLATAGKDGYNANKNIQEWQKLGEEAKATGEEKYRYADEVEWTGDEEVGPIVTEQFLSLQTVPVCAFSEMGIIEWKSDLPCLRYGNSAFNNGPLEVFEGNMPNLVDGGYMFANNTSTLSLVSFKSEMPSLINASYMFEGCTGLTSWNGTLGNSLTNVYEMFQGCSGLTSWNVALPDSITDARNMFCVCTGLTSFSAAMPNRLTYASGMFYDCKLNKDSVQNIVDTIPTYASDSHAISIGVDGTKITQAEQDAFSTTLTNKGWTVAWQRK